ncbi:MAG: hypothetical protein A2X94_06500 [Bdellovibrionales bacterium GWB1_55_8]|nr:MAG: hypothetical protein A2X94_06500 [Bdellovibrionales bacterium GWB1_55_8]
MIFGKPRPNEKPARSDASEALQQPLSRAKNLLLRFQEIRHKTEMICDPLLAEDYGVQPMLDASPPKWHLAHTSWFIEALFLRPFVRAYRSYDPYYDYLFNSYYKSAGPHLDRSRRGLLCRPTTYEIRNYRRYVDSAVEEALESLSDAGSGKLLLTLEVALNHEQQHQELLLTDIKAIFWSNPLRPTYHREPAPNTYQDSLPGLNGAPQGASHEWIEIPGGLREIGMTGENFAYDNERPRHRTWLEPFRLRTKLVTNSEYLEFVESGGYHNPMLWLSEGWDTIQSRHWEAPLYWEKHGSGWQLFTLSGMKKIDPAEPVCHISYFEADAFCRWKGARLPTEAEWEVAAAGTPLEGNFAESGVYHPMKQTTDFQFWGDAWEWTRSSYLPYPGFKPLEGALGEYNEKFMINQMVLRGGSCATPRSHVRASYRNYFEPGARWQFSGFRMAV